MHCGSANRASPGAIGGGAIRRAEVASRVARAAVRSRSSSAISPCSRHAGQSDRRWPVTDHQDTWFTDRLGTQQARLAAAAPYQSASALSRAKLGSRLMFAVVNGTAPDSAGAPQIKAIRPYATILASIRHRRTERKRTIRRAKRGGSWIRSSTTWVTGQRFNRKSVSVCFSIATASRAKRTRISLSKPGLVSSASISSMKRSFSEAIAWRWYIRRDWRW